MIEDLCCKDVVVHRDDFGFPRSRGNDVPAMRQDRRELSTYDGAPTLHDVELETGRDRVRREMRLGLLSRDGISADASGGRSVRLETRGCRWHSTAADLDAA